MKIAVVGSGLIGQSWSMIFASKGYSVCMFDIDPSQVTKALELTKKTMCQYERDGCLRGDATAEDQGKLISGSTNLAECIHGAFYLQECVPEDVELKKKVFKQIDDLASDDIVLASSSSCICPSKFNGDLKHKQNILVAHPVNPPYFLPLVEIVPSPDTKPEAVSRTRDLMSEVGQSPVTLRREALGFALNRIQYAIINECWDMYKTGLLSAEDIEKVMTDGLGPRYAFIGPLETMHLNADGVVNYCERYAEGGFKVQETMLPPPVRWDVETAAKIEQDFSESMPVDRLNERRERRNRLLTRFAQLRKQEK